MADDIATIIRALGTTRAGDFFARSRASVLRKDTAEEASSIPRPGIAISAKGQGALRKMS